MAARIVKTNMSGTRSLREQIQLAKQELEHHFQNYHRLLHEKEQALTSELDAILASVSELHEKRRELIDSETELEEKMKRNEFHLMKDKLLEVVSIKMTEIEHLVSVSEREEIKLEWKDSEMFAAIENSCIVTKQKVSPSRKLQVSLKSVGTLGSRVGELCRPRSVAIDPENQDIYVADKEKHRIVIYNRNRIFVRNMSVESLKWPYAIVVVSDFCFVSSSRSKGLILKLAKSTGELAAFFDPGVNMFALTFDQETKMLFTCPVYSKSVWCIELSELEKVSEITLQTRYFLQNTTEIHDLKTLKDEIYVLFTNSPYPLQSFSRDGNLIKTIISQDIVNKIQYFCIDTQNNFIISDAHADKILVASPDGEILVTLCTYSDDGVDSTDIIDPRGVAMMENGHIVFVCGGKKKISYEP